MHALATAAGCQLVATCDLAVAAEEAAFAIPGGKGGLFCHTPLVAVARNIGRKRALEMAFTGDAIDARDRGGLGPDQPGRPGRAARRGHVGPDHAGHARQRRRRRGCGKQGFYAQIGLDQDNAYAFAVELMAAAAMIPDAQEAFAAFLEKRKPQFQPPR